MPDIKIKVKNEYIQRLEGEPNSLFIMKLSRPMCNDAVERIKSQIEPLIDEFYKSSKVMILPPEVESIRHINEDDLNEAGWFKKPVELL